MLSLVEPSAHKWLVEPVRTQVTSPVVDEYADTDLTEAAITGPYFSYNAPHAEESVFLQIGDLSFVRQVLIVAGKMEQNCAGSRKTQSLEQSSPVGTDAAQLLHGQAETLLATVGGNWMGHGRILPA